MGKDTPRFPEGVSTDQVVREDSTELGFSRPYGFGDRQAPYENLADFSVCRTERSCLLRREVYIRLLRVSRGHPPRTATRSAPTPHLAVGL